MKKILVGAIAFFYIINIRAQVLKMLKNDVVVATYTINQADKVVFEYSKDIDPNLLPGNFSVGVGPDGKSGTSDDKRVHFSKSNLYWDEKCRTFKFEDDQAGYFFSRGGEHICTFYWTDSAGLSILHKYLTTYSTEGVPFFAESRGGLTIEGTSGLYVLSKAEWDYLINKRPNAQRLIKCGVTVGTSTNCLIIAPDDFRQSLKSFYTVIEVDALGLVCLPVQKLNGYYWSSTGHGKNEAMILYFDSEEVCVDYDYRGRTYNIRLVVSAQ